MAEYKSNSNKSKAMEKDLAERKAERVITGTARVKKKSEIRKFADVFIADDINTVKTYILMDVVIPTIKKAVLDTVEMVLYGSSGSRKSGANKSTASKISYRSYYENPKRSDHSSANAKPHNEIEYDEITFETRGDAENVLARLREDLKAFDTVSINTLYDRAGVTTTKYTYNKYGWTDLRDAYVYRQIGGGYLIKFPPAIYLD